MQENGISKEEIINLLENYLKNDMKYESGRILGSMCTNPDDFALEIFMKYPYKNLGDPGLFPGTLEIEKDLIKQMGELYGGKKITGSIVTGGSEANIIAMRIAKKLRPEIKKPEIVCSENAHMSFYKAADLMGLTVRSVKLTKDFVPDMNDYASKINKNTIALIGIAGTTSLGLVEQIQEIAKLAEPEHLFFHVDAAFGGFVLPFMEDLGYNFSPYDFRVSAVDSMTSDPHKMGMGLIPGGGILLRENSAFEKFGYSIPYLAGGDFKHLHITGTRQGGTVVAFWALMKHMGRAGFKKIVKDCYENTLYLEKRIKEIDGIDIAYPAKINVIGIKPCENITNSICRVDQELRKRGWALGLFRNLNIARIVCMPHIKRHHLEQFTEDLEESVKKIKSEGSF